VLDLRPHVEQLASPPSSGFNCLSGPVRKFAVIGLPHASTNRDGDLDIDVTLDRIRVGADGVRALDQANVRYISRFFEAMLHQDAIARIIDPYGGPIGRKLRYSTEARL
jgi:hypothetical protein